MEGALAALLLRAVHAVYSLCLCVLEAARWLRYFVLDMLWPCRLRTNAAPEHVGVVVGVDEAAQTDRIALLVGWCASAGIRRLTLCDSQGKMLRRARDLGAQLAACDVHAVIEDEAMDPVANVADITSGAFAPAKALGGKDGGGSSGELRVRIISTQTGRQELVNAARVLCAEAQAHRLHPSSIDEAFVDATLRRVRKTPEVGLVLQYCEEPLLGGLLPWHTRIAHYVHMGKLRWARESALHLSLIHI